MWLIKLPRVEFVESGHFVGISSISTVVFSRKIHFRNRGYEQLLLELVINFEKSIFHDVQLKLKSRLEVYAKFNFL